MSAYYNEVDPYAAQWLRNLISAGHIAYGFVDERSIEDVHPIELREFTQCHFFAGIGVWSRALRIAGWPDSRPVWTGSCPCQPFSSAGKGIGFADERHLWPAFNHLISECRPAVVFGEQVASKDGLAWLDLVRADLEATGYAAGAADLCAAGVGAPHIRQRLYWVADAYGGDTSAERQQRSGQQRQQPQDGRGVGGLDHARHDNDASQVKAASDREPKTNGPTNQPGVPLGWMADNIMQQRQDGQSAVRAMHDETGRDKGSAAAAGLCGNMRPGPINGFWSSADWLGCRDGKWRPVEPGTFPLAHGAPSRVGRLRAYGNAIVPQVAAAFIQAWLDCQP